MSRLLVGAGKACITPPPEMLPIPENKFDWGRRAALVSDVYDDTFCRAIAIDNGTDKVLFLTFDLSGCPNVPTLKQEVADATGFPVENIITAATHNHTGAYDAITGGSSAKPAEGEVEWKESYRAVELKGAIEAAKQAVATLRPAKYGFGESLSYINTNRDMLTPGGYWTEARNLAGYSDKTLAIIKFVDLEGNLIAALMNHPTHATCCYMYNDVDHKRKISGNFTGIASRFVEESFPGSVALWTSGAAGNQNPLLSHGMQWEYPDGYSTAVNYPDGVAHMQMEFMGRWHGSDCVKGIKEITEYAEVMPIKHVQKIVKLPAQKKVLKEGVIFPFRMGDNGMRDFEKYPVGTRPAVPDTDVLVPDPENPVDFRLNLLILGDIAILGANAELYCEIGRDMKAASPLKKVFVVTHTDYRKAGYILDKTSKDKKVFQAFSNVIPGSSDELIIEGELELFDEALAD